MKVGLSVWEGRISPVFDVSREVLLLTIENGVALSRRNENIEAGTPAAKIERLLALGIDTLVCGAISGPLQQELGTRGVRIIAFIAGEIDEVVAGLLAGKLPSETLSMPGCGWRHGRFHGGRGYQQGRPDGARCKRRR